MLNNIIHNPEMEKYLVSYETGETLFFEGDDSQDIYVLVSGKLDILKGTKKIADIVKEGVVFGEMSFLLNEKRTATVKAMTDVKAIRIPKENVEPFLKEFPEVFTVVAKFLAKRLDATSQTLFGFRELCDQLPDAVMIIDKDGTISTWNSAAEKLYGRDDAQMRGKSAERIYDDPLVYRNLLEELKAGDTIQEKILKIRHPEKGICFVSTSTKVLYDGQHNFRGVLFVGRDVTSVENLERRYKRTRRWLIPTMALLALFTVGILFGYPYFSKGYKITDSRKRQFRDDLSVTFKMLESFLADPLRTGDRAKTKQIIKGFLDVQKGISIPYNGLILLDENKKVFEAYATLPGFDAEKMVNSSYSGISFDQSANRPYSVLTLYRATKQNPMGSKAVEMAFEIKKDGVFLGWLVFQVDLEKLKEKYNVNEDDLKHLPFDGS